MAVAGQVVTDDPERGRVAGLVLAAGASRRLGRPKQLACVGEETLLERAVRVARAAGLAPIIVVLGAAAGEIAAECRLGDAEVLLNPEWAEGMGSSLRRGIAALSAKVGCAGAVVMTCDMPLVSAEHLESLALGGACAVASFYGGRSGVPAYFPASCFAELRGVRGDVGARAMLDGVPTIALAGSELDVDTEEELRQARLTLRGRE